MRGVRGKAIRSSFFSFATVAECMATAESFRLLSPSRAVASTKLAPSMTSAPPVSPEISRTLDVILLAAIAPFRVAIRTACLRRAQ
jgi:hypothetical protein